MKISPSITEITLTRLVMAAKGQYQFSSEQFETSRQEGFDTTWLESWKPIEKDGELLEIAINAVNKITGPDQIHDLIANPTEYKHKMQFLLSGGEAWDSLRRLAEAFLDRKRLDALVRTNTITRIHDISTIRNTPILIGSLDFGQSYPISPRIGSSKWLIFA